MESKGQTFNDVLFVPQYSEIEHRREISTTTNMGQFNLSLPIISANMKDVTGPKMVVEMFKAGGLGILHRFNTIEENVEDFFIAKKYLEHDPQGHLWAFDFGVSVGVVDYERTRFNELYRVGARLFTVDVAHGHHILVKNMLDYMRKKAGDEICIIAGNVATTSGAKDLKEWGADIIKIGIGPGSCCVTRRNTGVGVPQLKAIRDINHECPDILIISDGGIKHYGDIPKALKYSNAVMLGSLLAGTSETPGHVYENEEEEHYKVYGGSSSGERKIENGRDNAFIEGVVKTVKFKGKVKYILRKAKESLQSSMSYSGANNLALFRKMAILEDIGSGAKSESRL